MRLLTRLVCPLVATAAALAAAPLDKFDFSGSQARPGFVSVSPNAAYSMGEGFGFEPGSTPTLRTKTGSGGERTGFITSDRPFHFTTRVPREGNYRVTVTLGDAEDESNTTIKTELRRLAIAPLRTRRGEFKTVSFIVNVRTPIIPPRNGVAAGRVKLKAPRETIQEAWAWDDALTLEFSGSKPAVRTVVVEPVDVPTIFLLGDSTVCDQSKEPYNSWGQMLTVFFKPEVAIANHGESGETYRDSIARRRLDKIISAMRPGDWLIMQFGHNDQKQIAAGTGGPFTTYQEEMRKHVAAVRGVGGNVVIVSPMERRGFDEAGRIKPSLADYAVAARSVANELNAPFIDLNAMSKTLYEALGIEGSAAAFAAPNGKIDNTHHNNFGSYELAKCIIQTIRDQRLPIARFIRDDVQPFDPAQPDGPSNFNVPASGEFTNERPLGD